MLLSIVDNRFSAMPFSLNFLSLKINISSALSTITPFFYFKVSFILFSKLHFYLPLPYIFLFFNIKIYQSFIIYFFIVFNINNNIIFLILIIKIFLLKYIFASFILISPFFHLILMNTKI